MKKVRCPKCDNFIIFDEKKYSDGQNLVFQCPECGKQFGIRIGRSRLHDGHKGATAATSTADECNAQDCGSITVIENVFHYKQVLPLRMGDNVIGRYQKGSGINTPIETADPSVDNTHCVINVSRDKRGGLQYVLRDGPSNTGTFVDNVLLGDRERRVISEGSLITIGATSIILHEAENKK